MYKLPILETVAEAYRFFGKNLLTIGKYALPMIVVVIGYSIMFQNLASTGLSRIMMHGVFSIFGVALLAQAIIVVAGVSFAITVHRLYFLGPDARGVLAGFTWQSRNWRFLGQAILVAIGALLIIVPLNFGFVFGLQDLVFKLAFGPQGPWAFYLVGGAFYLLVLTLVFFVIGAALLKFPLIAIEASAGVRERADDLIRGNRLRLAAIFLIGDIIPFAILNYVVVYAYSQSLGTEPQQSVSMATGIFFALIELQTVLWVGVTAVILSVICKKLMDNVSLSTPTNTTSSLNKGSAQDTSSP